jgi:Cdc6-like AAA superfamily ATPase
LGLSVIILAGARDSGKSTTLDEMAGRLKKAKKARTYSFESKTIRIYKSSPQEQCSPCDYRGVNAIIHRYVEECASENCALLIVPFTMGTNWQGELNTNCITKPIDHLRKLRVKKVHLVYLRKDPARGIDLMDNLMSQLRALRVIKSSKNTVGRQANELWKCIMRADP